MNKDIIDRFKEPSTWRGICLVLTAAGWALDPDQVAVIGTVGVAVAGLIGVFTRDRPKV